MKSLSTILEELYVKDIHELEHILLEKSNNNIKKNNSNEKRTNPYFFSNVLFFTNEREPEKNKTLKNLYDALDGTGVNIVVFVSDEVSYTSDNNNIIIKDNETEYVVDTQSNVDTIVIARLGVQESEACMATVTALQQWGLYTLNPVGASKRASNKYETSVLLSKHDIPQPRYTLLVKNDIKDGLDSLITKLINIYPDITKKNASDSVYEYVIKILDGHGGTGVFMTNGKMILSVLQAIFAINEDIELLCQKKEVADGGDIRVHVLTRRTDQCILGAMKRVKLGDDFRSNVSLGAEAQKVELTKEQEEIALKVAKISGMPWCAVDIMPLKKGSNPEIGDNVVLEYNASPGTDGISEVMGTNFVKVLLDGINDVNELTLSPRTAGYIEDIEITLESGSEITMEVKLDTGNGAKASTIGCEHIEVSGNNIVATINDRKYTFPKHGISNAKVGQVIESRNTVVIPRIKIGSRVLRDVPFALVDNRKEKSTKVLLNRDVMRKIGYVVDPSRKHILKED